MALITDDDVTRAGAQLHGARGWAYTPRQLYYATCAAAENAAPSTARGQIGLGLILVLVSVLLTRAGRVASLSVLAIAVLVILDGIRDLIRERGRPNMRTLPMSFTTFENRHLAPRLVHGAVALDGLLADADGTNPTVLPAGRDQPVVVCDRRDTAAQLEANRALAELGATIVDEDALAVIAERRTVYTLHDADPPGCRLPHRLAGKGHSVVDLGLHPSDVPDHAPVIEGPAALIDDTSTPLLNAEERGWLMSGRRFELAAVDPHTLAVAVRAALAAAPAVVAGEAVRGRLELPGARVHRADGGAVGISPHGGGSAL